MLLQKAKQDDAAPFLRLDEHSILRNEMIQKLVHEHRFKNGE